MREILVLVGYLKSTGLCCAVREYNSKCLVLRIILFSFAVGLALFDSYTHWRVWQTVRDSGLNHPLLKIPNTWTTAWLAFTCIGTASASLYLANELSGVIAFYRGYKDKGVKDICIPCRSVGLNFVTRSEILSLLTITLEDLPLLVLSLIFAAAQYSCNLPTPSGNLSILNVVFISSLASLIHVAWCMLRFLFFLILRTCGRKCNARKKSKRNTDEDEDEEKKQDFEEIRRKIKEKEAEIAPELKEDTSFKTRQLYATKFCQIKCCIVCHMTLLMTVGFLTLAISSTAIGLAKTPGLLSNNIFLDPNKQLSIYRIYPQEEIVANVSDIIDSDDYGLCISEELEVPNRNETFACNVAFLYDRKAASIFFNYNSSVVSNSSFINTTLTSDTRNTCSPYYTGLFLGHDSGGTIQKFHKTCLGVLLLQDNNNLLQRNEDILTICSTPLPVNQAFETK